LFLIKIFHFLKGYVILEVMGHNKEELISRMVKNGIKILDTSASGDRIKIRIFACDFIKLRELHPGCRVRIEKKCGLCFKLKRTRKSLLIGFVIFSMLAVLSSLFVWDISYEGVEHTDIKKLQEATRMAGLYPGMLKSNIKSGYEMKDIILNNTEGITWVWVYEKGTRIIVKVRENIIMLSFFLFIHMHLSLFAQNFASFITRIHHGT
jgi:similar to stage IV sporulation protein